ncbi:hypothetical protein IA57_07255 [Mangrovimonas yunxiaonensis]|uniref:GAF domain-containing protein n=1 Tax=Mangrovimonas yunxiaonensis TaxID=1197477 RepID=A0A084TLN2_9FLAO|nr:hypothetical protein [Mangrovimonas yunxiaonensis]KFB01618.1 hypothetical protein IA57_07255 [Mangrovimonas yunxiaonensis]GGH35628.1 hypothetical protein GCM10011364_02300 [Mangrovimonas yunxiaonensis]
MKKVKQIELGPFKMVYSLRFLKEKYEQIFREGDDVQKQQAKQALSVFEKHPVLANGTTSEAAFLENKEALGFLMGQLFPVALTENEIKVAVLPYTNQPFFMSQRMKKIVDLGNEIDIFGELYRDYDNSLDLLTYAIILNKYYKYDVDFDRPKTISVINENGEKKRFRAAFNGDFLDIYPNENAIEITQDILNKLLANANDKAVWKTYFPENSWTVEGFGIVNLLDTTLDEQIDDFKTHLIEPNRESFDSLAEDIRRIFNLPNLQVGSYGVDHKSIVPPYDKHFNTLTISSSDKISIDNYACCDFNRLLFEDVKPVVISNVEQYHDNCGGSRLSKILLEKGLKSVALIPISVDGDIEFVIELATDKVNQLNAINMVKLEAIMPFILSYSRRTINEYNNEISAVIQEECTSIHPSVQWRFEEEASKFILDRNYGESPVFEEIVFKDVLPLYGQTDIVASSKAQNKAIIEDLTKQLSQAKTILQDQIHDKSLPFYEQLIYQIDKYLLGLVKDYHANTEQEINLFFGNKLFPLFKYLLSTENHNEITAFLDTLDPDTKSLYNARKKYDETVSLANKLLSSFLDKQQIKAQKIFPHYFEKFKTDGIEHNMYVGQAISKYHQYHEVALYNLRLWQLQATCEMEAMYYTKQQEFPLKLEVASLILAYDVPINIRYRMDEKQFDVDGAYNVRYEMIKKRIDKAHIKNTNERLTQPHKLCVVYSSKAIEREYLNYFEFLQAKNYIGKNIEVVELEELQGASGIKAIRVDMNHDLKQVKEVFTVKDLQVV